MMSRMFGDCHDVEHVRMNVVSLKVNGRIMHNVPVQGPSVSGGLAEALQELELEDGPRKVADHIVVLQIKKYS